MTDPTQAAVPIECASCHAQHFVADLDFPEPDEDTNTQFGWLVAKCPTCGADMKVGIDKLSF